MKNKNKNLKKDEVIRFPRPLGTTLQAINMNKETDTLIRSGKLKQLQKTLLTHYVSQNYSFNGRSISVQEFSNFLGIGIGQLSREMLKAFQGMGMGFGESEVQRTYEGLVGVLYGMAQEDRGMVRDQVCILTKAQSGRHRAFISGEVNNALGLQLRTQESFFKLASLIKPNSKPAYPLVVPSGQHIHYHNGQPQNTNTQKEFITVDKAVLMLQDAKQQNLLPQPDFSQYLIDTPEVIATRQENELSKQDTMALGSKLGKAEDHEVFRIKRRNPHA